MVEEKLSALEQLALKGILELDITRGAKRLSFPGGGSYVVEFATKPNEVYKAVRMLVEESPKVVEKAAHYFLNAEDSHYRRSERVMYAVSLLKEIGKSDKDIVQRVVETIKGKTAYHTIERYHVRLGKEYYGDGRVNLVNLRGNNPEMYGKVMGGLTRLITPDLIIEVVAGLRGKDKEYARGDFYRGLCQMRDNIQKVVRNQAAPERKDLAIFIENMKEERKTFNELISEKARLIYGILDDFSATLGKDEFKRRGYTYEALDGEKGFRTELQYLFREEIDGNLQELSKELERKKRPWNKKMFSR